MRSGSEADEGCEDPTPPASSSEVQLYDVVLPNDNDVLCGRGVTTNRHPGNEKFRNLVAQSKELYVTSSKRQKTTVSRTIVEQVRALDPPGRFLERDMLTGMYFDVGDRKAIEKTSQALRDGAAELRRQLSSIEATADMATTDGSSSSSSSSAASSDCGRAEPATPSPPSSPKGKGKAKCPRKKGRGTHSTKPNRYTGTPRRRVSGSHIHHHSPCESFTPSHYPTPSSNQWCTPSPPRMPPPLDRSYSMDHSWQTQSLRRSLSQPPLRWGPFDRTIPHPNWLAPEPQPRPASILRAWSYDPRFAPATLADFTPPPSPARKRTCRPREIVPRPSVVVGERADYFDDDDDQCDGENDVDSPSMSPLPLYGDEGDADDSLIMDLSEDLLVIP